jgi:hypothetical protein
VISAAVVAVIVVVKVNWLLAVSGIVLASWPAFLYLKKQGLQGLKEIVRRS